jgi:copper chaperone CopZ
MEKNVKEMMFQADNITCSSCAGDMEKILMDTEGILEAVVNFAKETVWIRYNPELLGRKEAFLAVRKLGYKITLLGEKQG